MTRRTSISSIPIETTGNGARAWIYAVSLNASLKLHFGYDCDEPRFRAVHGSLAPGATPDPAAPTAGAWAPLRPGTLMHHAMRYVCAGGKLDLGWGDVAVKAATPEEAGREIIRKRAAAK